MPNGLKAVIVVQSGEWNQIPFRDPEPAAPLRVIEEDEEKKWLRLADIALTNKHNFNPSKDAA